MDAIFESFARVVLAIFRWLFVEALIEIVGFYTGKYILLLLTFGQYPNEKQLEKHHTRISLLGLIAVFVLLFSASQLT